MKVSEFVARMEVDQPCGSAIPGANRGEDAAPTE